MAKNNESIGVGAEVAIAKAFGVHINPDYELRAEESTVELLLINDCIRKIFDKERIPYPTKHIAEGQNPVDFILTGGKTLSVKTNQKKLGKVAPQYIGQPTRETYFDYIEKHNIIPGFSFTGCLRERDWTDTEGSRIRIFQELSMQYTAVLMDMYWENMFECDYLLHFFNLENQMDPMENYVVFGKSTHRPIWEQEKFAFTQTLESWDESCTVKYEGISIGEFQAHHNRNCLKFRFNMDGVRRLLAKGLA